MTPLKQEYKELYAAELSKRVEMNNAVAQPVAIITAFGAALFFVFSDFTNPFSCVHLIETAIGLVVAFLLMNATIFLAQSHYNHDYAFIPTATQLETHRTALLGYYSDEKEKPSPAAIDDEVLSYIYEAYIQAASHNAQVNELRSCYLHYVRTAIIVALPLVLLLGALKIGTVYFAL